MKENDIELIHKFLDNELSEDEARLFKEKYKEDPSFKEEVNSQAQLWISLDAASGISRKVITERPHLRKFLQNRPQKAKEIQGPMNMKSFYRYAAIIIPLLAFGIILLMLANPQPSMENLYASYYKAPVNNLHKGNAEEKTAGFALLLESIDRSSERRIDSLREASDYFHFGIYCMDNQYFREAIYAFNRLISSGEKMYLEESEWYLGLCYLKTGRKEDALRIFSGIAAANGHKFQSESGELIKKIK